MTAPEPTSSAGRLSLGDAVSNQISAAAKVEVLLRLKVAGQPIYVWLLWAAAALTLAACPMMLSDPAMWAYLLDPELLAMIVIVGVQYTRSEIGVVWLSIRAWLRNQRRSHEAEPLKGARK